MKRIVHLSQALLNTFISTRKPQQAVLFAVFMGLTLILSLYYLISVPGTRYIFFFPHQNEDTVITETRFLKIKGNNGLKGQQFVEELVLGPQTPSCSGLFPDHLSLQSVFFHDKSLTVNFSGNSLITPGEWQSFQRGYELFKKNVFTNFPKVDRLYMYIDGIEVYSENPYEDAESKK